MARGELRVEVVHSAAPRQVSRVALVLPAASTVHDALRAGGVAFDDVAMHCAIWGRRCELTQLLREGDRVELCRALTVDPKQARRLRYNGQRQKRASKAAAAQAKSPRA